jgi:serine/threonine-protein kinase
VVRDLSSTSARPLPGSEGARSPFFSPDGEWIGFFDETALKKVNVAAGAALTLAEVQEARGGTWTHDGRIVYAPDVEGGLLVIDPAGGEPQPLTRLGVGEVSHRWPHADADGEWVVFTSQSQAEAGSAAGLQAVSIESGETKRLHRGGSYPQLAGESLLFFREGTLFSASVDRDLEILGDPRPILEGIRASDAGEGDAQFDRRAGALVYRSPGQGEGLAHLVLGFDPATALR